MSDGYKSVVAASRKSGRPYLLDFDSIPSSLSNVAFAIDYRDFKGKKSSRWVTYSSIKGNMLWAYCWISKDLRSFHLGRIENVIDQNGEARSVESIFPSASGFRQQETSYRKSRDIHRGYDRDDDDDGAGFDYAKPKVKSGFGAFSAAVGDRKIDEEKKAPEEPGLIAKTFGVLFVILVLFGIYTLLTKIF
tara:strand:- start:71530 stop:72102 length:573 start_codon:yes stop_codon:yes gene_type:complete